MNVFQRPRHFTTQTKHVRFQSPLAIPIVKHTVRLLNRFYYVCINPIVHLQHTLTVTVELFRLLIGF